MIDFLVAGGDKRSFFLADELRKAGFKVELMGFDAGDAEKVHPELARNVLLPYPHSVRDGLIRSGVGMDIPFQPLLERLSPGTTIFHHGTTGGRDEERFLWRLYDSDPDFIRENAAISAEGALYALMDATEDSLMNMRCLVTGYGVFARTLTQRLLAFGACVTVAARREEALRLASLDGAKVCPLFQLFDLEGTFDAVLNTVPAKVLEDGFINILKRGCILMELAGQKRGFDQKFAVESGMKVLFLPGIPGKYAPRAAAKTLKKTILSSLEEKK